MSQQQLLAPWAAEDALIEQGERRRKPETKTCPRCGSKATLTRDGVKYGSWRCLRCDQPFTTCRWEGCSHVHLGEEPGPLCEGCGSWYRMERLREDYPGQVIPNCFGLSAQKEFKPLPGELEDEREAA